MRPASRVCQALAFARWKNADSRRGAWQCLERRTPDAIHEDRTGLEVDAPVDVAPGDALHDTLVDEVVLGSSLFGDNGDREVTTGERTGIEATSTRY